MKDGIGPTLIRPRALNAGVNTKDRPGIPGEPVGGLGVAAVGRFLRRIRDALDKDRNVRTLAGAHSRSHVV